jgi:CheY-like chemotaxis protein
LGDADRIRQILLNLLSNAVKFTSNGSVTVTARAEASPDGATLLHIWVTDTGIGIPEDRMSRLFERFSQVDGSMSRNYGGTGLGLAICKRIVRLMGGEIGVDSQPGHGSTFWFSLPLQSVELPCSARAICRNGDDAIPRRRSVLLVEDTELNREIAVAMMEAAGHTVDAAANGAQALQCAAAKTYDLILMDIQMPDMDGITVARHIRAGSGPNTCTPIIALTANVLPEQIARFHAAGMNGHIGKPIDLNELLRTLEDGRLAHNTAALPLVEASSPAG